MKTVIAPEIKAAALADLYSGDTPAVVAARYHLSPALVRTWKARHVTPADTPHGPAADTLAVTLAGAPPISLAALIEANIRAKLTATTRLVELAGDPAWFMQQTATDVAVLFAAIDGSAIAILDRLAQRPEPAGIAPDRSTTVFGGT